MPGNLVRGQALTPRPQKLAVAPGVPGASGAQRAEPRRKSLTMAGRITTASSDTPSKAALNAPPLTGPEPGIGGGNQPPGNAPAMPQAAVPILAVQTRMCRRAARPSEDPGRRVPLALTAASQARGLHGAATLCQAWDHTVAPCTACCRRGAGRSTAAGKRGRRWRWAMAAWRWRQACPSDRRQDGPGPISPPCQPGPPGAAPGFLNAPGGRPSKRWKDRRIRSVLPNPQASAMRCTEG